MEQEFTRGDNESTASWNERLIDRQFDNLARIRADVDAARVDDEPYTEAA